MSNANQPFYVFGAMGSTYMYTYTAYLRTPKKEKFWAVKEREY